MVKMKIVISIIIINLNILPTLLIAMPRSSSLTNKSLYSVGTRSERTGIKTGWGMQNKHPSMVDLSEWGGKRPSCSEAPECPVCIP